jgi:hypothetical protein
MKKFLIIISFIGLFISCNNSENINPNFTYKEKTDSTTSQYQYDIKLEDYDVDIRTVNIKNHEYIVATSYVGRGGGVGIIHSESCKCKNNE